MDKLLTLIYTILDFCFLEIVLSTDILITEVDVLMFKDVNSLGHVPYTRVN